MVRTERGFGRVAAFGSTEAYGSSQKEVGQILSTWSLTGVGFGVPTVLSFVFPKLIKTNKT